MHSHGIDTFAVILDRDISRLDFAMALGGLAGTFGSDLLRVKGIVRFADADNRPAVVQAAQHTMFAPEWLVDWPDSDHRSRLVFIVHDIPRGEVLARFAAASPMLAHGGAEPALHHH
jgi:G3E family GTPase